MDPKSNDLILPHNYIPRDYQTPFLKAMDEGAKRAACVWHRRSGKDKTFLNYMIKEMPRRRGTYYYFFPNYNQGRKILWDGIDRDGFPYMEHFPGSIIAKKNNTEMKITTIFGSIFQIIGTDNIDTVRGTNPVGCIFSEYALQDPLAWETISPILIENGGFGIFNYTPRGRNHGYKLYTSSQRSEKWFSQKLTIDDTRRPNGLPVISDEMIQSERDRGADESFIQQEYWCSFDAALQSCFFGNTLARHKYTSGGIRGNIQKDSEGDYIFFPEKLGVITFWRFPYYLNPNWDGRIWENRYAAGTDVGEGVGQNYSVSYIYDRLLNEFVCRMRSNKIDAYTWAEKLYALCQFYENALVCVERNGPGITTIKALIQMKARQYVKIIPAKVGKGRTTQIGWNETKQTKFELAGDLKEYFRSTKGTVHDNLLLEEASTFIKDESDRLLADDGFYDDSIFGGGCTLQAHKYLGKKPTVVDTSRTDWISKRQAKQEEALEWVTS